MPIYQCFKELILNKFDEHGFSIENEFIRVTIGSRWEEDDDGNDYKFIASNDAIRLDEITIDNHCSWIEIHEDTLVNHFIKLD